MNIKEEVVDDCEIVKVKTEINDNVKIKEEIQVKTEITSNEDDINDQLKRSRNEDSALIPKDYCIENKFKCPQCSYSTDVKSNLSYHIIYKHTPESDLQYFQCPICNVYRAKTEVYLRRHMKIHAPTQYNCDKCNYSSKNKRYLKEHIYKKHELKEKYKCKHCSYSSYNKGNLEDHITDKHTPEEEKIYYFCQFCSFKTTSQRHLGRHKHNNKKFDCTECEFSTKYNCNLKQHMYAKHTGPSSMKD